MSQKYVCDLSRLLCRWQPGEYLANRPRCLASKSQVRELTGALWIITVSVVPGPPSVSMMPLLADHSSPGVPMILWLAMLGQSVGWKSSED